MPQISKSVSHALGCFGGSCHFLFLANHQFLPLRRHSKRGERSSKPHGEKKPHKQQGQTSNIHMCYRSSTIWDTDEETVTDASTTNKIRRQMFFPPVPWEINGSLPDALCYGELNPFDLNLGRTLNLGRSFNSASTDSKKHEAPLSRASWA